MVKRQKDKQYESAREHRANQSLRSGSSSRGAPATRPLPFDCCALTLTPYTTPVCTSDGIIFDNASIVQHLLKYKVDPVTGRAMTSRDVVVLNMDRDESTGQWQCPILNKPFTNRTKVIAIIQRPPGNEANVISWGAYHELNIKAKNKIDLISGKKFSKEDVLVLNDPDDEELCRLRDIQNFSHIKSQREASTRQQSALVSNNVRHSVTASRIMNKLERAKRKREKAAEDQATKLLTIGNAPSSTSNKGGPIQIYTDELLTSVNLTSGKASGSLTSTTMNVTRENKARLATEEEIIASQCEQLQRLKKKGMVRVFTNKGAMDIEVHCDIVPRTAMNFLLLAEKGEYNGVDFHRSIRNFMLQGGKKPGIKGSDGGSSVWEKPFADEFDDRLTHAGGGIVSMANSGPGTNGRQFFITYRTCAHLNRKHSIFGKVVGGLEILRKLEEVPTNKDTDKPLERLYIESMDILENPLTEALEMERERVRNRKEEKRVLEQARKTSASVCIGSGPPPVIPPGSGATDDDSKDGGPPPISIGKYLKMAKTNSKKRTKNISNGHGASDVSSGESISRLPPPPKKTTFGDFSGW